VSSPQNEGALTTWRIAQLAPHPDLPHHRPGQIRPDAVAQCTDGLQFNCQREPLNTRTHGLGQEGRIVMPLPLASTLIVSVAKLPTDWWSIAGAALSVIAVGAALWTVRQNAASLKEVQAQSAALTQQTTEITRALLRPALRITRSREALSSIQETVRLPGVRYPNFHTALTNIGTGRATNIDVAVEGDVFSIQLGERRYLVSDHDFIILAIYLGDSANPHEGYITIKATYEDVIHNKYAYRCVMRYAGPAVVATQDEDDWPIA